MWPVELALPATFRVVTRLWWRCVPLPHTGRAAGAHDPHAWPARAAGERDRSASSVADEAADPDRSD
jgi:hypothetical protein